MVMSSTSRATGRPWASTTSNAGDRCRNTPTPGTTDGSESVWNDRRT